MNELLLFILSTGAVNSVYGTFGISLLVIVFVQAMKSRTLKLGALNHTNFWVMICFGLTYFAIGEQTIQGLLYYCLTPVLAYCAGWSICENEKANRSKLICRIILAILIGYAVHAFQNYMINKDVVVRSQLRDVYSGVMRAATGSGAINTLSFSLIAYFLFIEKNVAAKAVGITAFSISFAYAFILGTRTQFIILIFTVIVVLLVYMIEKKGCAGGLLFVFFAIIFVALAYLIVYHFELFGIKNFIENSNLARRYVEGSGIEDADQYRFGSIFRGLTNLFVYPFGVPKGLTSYYHNLWLDVGRIGGVIPFFFITILTISSLYRVLRLSFDKGLDFKSRYMFFSVYLGYYVNFAVEPILEGFKDYFYIFCILNGMLECLYYNRAFHKNIL